MEWQKQWLSPCTLKFAQTVLTWTVCVSDGCAHDAREKEQYIYERERERALPAWLLVD